MRYSATENRFMGLTLELDARPTATRCNFLTHDGGLAFKIAFDKQWAKFSPGTILEKETVVRLCDDPNPRWMDSCAVPDHPR